MFSQVIYNATTRSFGETKPIDLEMFLGGLSKQEELVVLHGLYDGETKKTPKVIRKHLLALMDAMIPLKDTHPNLVVVTTSDKKLEVPMDEEVAKRSKVYYPEGAYPAGMDKRAEGTLSFHNSGILWKSMVFDFSNFGHTPIDIKVSDLFSFDQLKETVSKSTTKCVNWKALKKVMGFKISTVEFIIQAFMKTIASALMPATLDSEAAINTFKFNVGKLGKIEIGGAKINRMVIIRTKEELEQGLSHVFGVKRSEEDLNKPFVDDKTTLELNGLVGFVNDFIHELFDMELSDRQVKDLANALHISPVFFQGVGNGTPYKIGQLGTDIGVNTYSQAAGNLLREATDPEFAEFMGELRARVAEICEAAAHKRMDKNDNPFYYIDNTFGGDFGNLAPPQKGVLFDGKEHTFYNAMAHGYYLAQLHGNKTSDEYTHAAAELLLVAVARIAAAF